MVPERQPYETVTKGNHIDSKFHYDRVTETLFLNGFDKGIPIDEKVWNYRIGSYQVVRKWVMQRIGHTVNASFKHHLNHVVESISALNRLMARLDEGP